MMHGLTPERELCGLPFRLSLVGDVSFDRLPVSLFRYCGKIVAVAQEFTAPELFAQFRESP